MDKEATCKVASAGMLAFSIDIITGGGGCIDADSGWTAGVEMALKLMLVPIVVMVMMMGWMVADYTKTHIGRLPFPQWYQSLVSICGCLRLLY